MAFFLSLFSSIWKVMEEEGGGSEGGEKQQGRKHTSALPSDGLQWKRTMWVYGQERAGEDSPHLTRQRAEHVAKIVCHAMNQERTPR